MVTAVVDRGGLRNAPEVTQASPAGGPQAAQAVRFTYPSGSRPLPGYTIRRAIGRGGFGEVYYAVSDGGKDVALKLLCRHWDVELRGITHCLNLKHPNLLTIYDVLRDEHGDTWVVMEYIRGPSLEQVLNEHPQGLPLEEALKWFHGLAAGVAYLHSRGIVHRDLKPGNIFWEENVVKVGDYGLAKFISCSRRSGQTESVGTVHYMAPEIAQGRYGKEVDIYALGIVLYEILTGQVPFEGETVAEILMKHLTAQPDLSRIPVSVRSIIGQALEKDPSRRFGSVAEMLARLPPAQAEGVFVGPIPGAALAGTPSPPSPSGGPQQEAGCAELVPLAELVSEGHPPREPIFHAVQQGVGELWAAWKNSRLAIPLKVLIVIAVAMLVVSHAGMLGLLILPLLMAYAVYWIVRSILLATSPQATPAGARPPPVAAAAPQPPAPLRPAPPPSRAEVFRQRRAEMPFRARLAELLGSMLLSVLVAAVMALVAYLIQTFRGQLWNISQGAWVFFMSIAATWSVLILSQFWQGRDGDVVQRRFVTMVVGMLLGGVAFYAQQYLLVDLVFNPQWPGLVHWQPPPTFYRDGRPVLPAMLAVFGTLFLLVRWWRLADPLRRIRFSLWGVVGPGLAALLAAAVWMFPAQWLFWVAVATGTTLQLASPWFGTRRRNAVLGNHES